MKSVLIRVHPYKENISDALFSNITEVDCIIHFKEVAKANRFDEETSFALLTISPYLTFELIENEKRSVTRNITDARNFLLNR